MTNTTAPETFAAMTTDDRWLGHGYIGGRANAIEAVTSGEWSPAALEQVAAADALALEMGATLTDDELFEWANSKDGRWFADCALGCNDLAMARRYGPRP